MKITETNFNGIPGFRNEDGNVILYLKTHDHYVLYAPPKSGDDAPCGYRESTINAESIMAILNDYLPLESVKIRCRELLSKGNSPKQ